MIIAKILPSLIGLCLNVTGAGIEELLGANVNIGGKRVLPCCNNLHCGNLNPITSIGVRSSDHILKKSINSELTYVVDLPMKCYLEKERSRV